MDGTVVKLGIVYIELVDHDQRKIHQALGAHIEPSPLSGGVQSCLDWAIEY